MLAFGVCLAAPDESWAAPEQANGYEDLQDEYVDEENYVDENGNIDFDNEDVDVDEDVDEDSDEESDYYVPEGDGATGRTAGDLDSNLSAQAADRAKSKTPFLSAGRHMGATVARIAVGDSAMPGRNEDANVDFVSSIPELIQWDSLIGGCEIVSMTSVLNAMGYEVTPQRIADE